MIRVLLCVTQRSLDELGGTWIMRGGIERQFANHLQEALAMAASRPPRLVVIDRDFPQAVQLARALRDDPKTRKLSVAVLAPADIDSEDAATFEASANVLLRSPVSPEWGERLGRLLAVESRRAVRVPVRVVFEGSGGANRSRITGMAHNLSVSGILLECVMHLRIGEPVEIFLTLPGTDTPLRARGRTVRQQAPGATGVSGYGVAFDGLDDEAASRIRRFVRSGRP